MLIVTFNPNIRSYLRCLRYQWNLGRAQKGRLQARLGTGWFWFLDNGMDSWRRLLLGWVCNSSVLLCGTKRMHEFILEYMLRIDVGASQLIIDGKIKLKNDSQIARFGKKTIVFENGSEIPADVVVFCTGSVQSVLFSKATFVSCLIIFLNRIL